MAIETGTITSITGGTPPTTNQYSVLSAQPVAMIFWGGFVETLDSDTTPVCQFHGVTDGTNDGCISASANGGTITESRSTTECIEIVEPGTGVIVSAGLSAWDSSSFTLNFTTNHATKAYQIHYMAISGADITDAYVDNFSFPATAAPTTDASTAPGFQPEFLFVIARKATRNGYSVGVSKGTASGDEWAMGFRWRSGVATRYTSYNDSDRLALMADDSATPEQEFSLSSFESTGYVISKDVGGANASDFTILSLKGGSFDVGNWGSPTSGAPVDESVGSLAFDPEGYYIQTVDATGTTTGGANSVPTGYGASDGTMEVASWFDVNGTTDEDHGMSNTKVIQLRNQSGTLVEDADHKSLDTGGFTVTYTNVDAAANRAMWFAVTGTAAVGGATSKLVVLSRHRGR